MKVIIDINKYQNSLNHKIEDDIIKVYNSQLKNQNYLINKITIFHTFYNINSTNKTININYDGTDYIITLTEGYYNNFLDLRDELKTQLLVIDAGFDVIYNDLTETFTISHTTNTFNFTSRHVLYGIYEFTTPVTSYQTNRLNLLANYGFYLMSENIISEFQNDNKKLLKLQHSVNSDIIQFEHNQINNIVKIMNSNYINFYLVDDIFYKKIPIDNLYIEFEEL